MSKPTPLIEQGRRLDDAIEEFVRKNPNSPVRAVWENVCPEYSYTGAYTAARRLIESGRLGAGRIGHILLLTAPAEADE